jgi:Auxin binding protein
MYSIDHTTLRRMQADGLETVVVACVEMGIEAFELRLETIAPCHESAICPNAGDCAIVALAGYGKLLIDGAPQRFHAPCTLILPRNEECQIVNVGTETMHLPVALSRVPPAQQSSLAA